MDRKQCFYNQCAANYDDTLEEPSERRYMAGRSTLRGWYWFCVECAEQIDAEAREAKKECRYFEWNGGYDHITGEEIDPDDIDFQV